MLTGIQECLLPHLTTLGHGSLNTSLIAILRELHQVLRLSGSQFSQSQLLHLTLIVLIHLAGIVLFQQEFLALLIGLVFLLRILEFILGSLTPYLIEQHRTVLAQLLREGRNHFL